MERKLVKQGANTLFVSLPSTWIKNNNLLKGSVVNLNIKNNKIVVSSLFNNSNNIKEYSDKITNFDRIYLKSFFDNLNKIGYDIINLNIDDKKSIPIFEKILNEYFMNLEIIGYENKILKISNIATNNLLIIENLLTKIIYIIENLLKMLKSNIDLNEIDRYNKQIFKLKSYMQRVL